MQLKQLQKKYPQFIYDKYNYRINEKNLIISFTFKIEPEIFFKPKITIKNIRRSDIPTNLKNLIFHLGLIEMISYWKATCSPEIIIKAGYLNKKQIKWWQDLTIKGMGQFFYENKIKFQKPRFTCLHEPSVSKAKRQEETKSLRPGQKNNFSINYKLKNRYLVPIGGGKDSIVTLELLKKDKKEIKCFGLNPIDATKKIMKIGKCNNSIIVKRKIDKRLLELNQKGFLNGHTPFSAYLAFLSVLLAVIFDYKNISFSNAKSANEGNVKYLGKIINHQWSKSFEFEKKFSKYSKKYLAKNVEYFSLLRHLSEIQIAELFSKCPKYFSVFLSCNEAYKTASGTKKPFKKWCGKCSKCLFVFTILYPFIDEKNLFKIFGKNLFEDKKLLPIMRELIGERGNKPFECVGTYKESKMAFRLCLKKALRQTCDKPIPYILQKFK